MKKILIGIFIAIFLALTSTAFAANKKSNKSISIEYYYTAEYSYQKIIVNNSKLIYSYVEKEKLKCPNVGPLTGGMPCWRESDAKTVSANLSNKEVNRLFNLIERIPRSLLRG